MTYQIDTIVKDKIIKTVTTDDVRWALWYLMMANQYCLTSKARIYRTNDKGVKEELFW